jgi:hypothetical protein
MKELLAVKDIQELTGFSDSKIRQLINTKALIAVKVDSAIRVRRADFLTWVDGLEVTQ